MKTVIAEKNLYRAYRSCIRQIVLLALLTGLLFSAGEGIRLLPLPDSSGGAADDLSRILSEDASSFNFTVHHPGSYSLKIKSENQKNLKRFLTAADVNFAGLTAAEKFRAVSQKDNFGLNVFHSSYLLGSTSDRAPPAV